MVATNRVILTYVFVLLLSCKTQYESTLNEELNTAAPVQVDLVPIDQNGIYPSLTKSASDLPLIVTVGGRSYKNTFMLPKSGNADTRMAKRYKFQLVFEDNSQEIREDQFPAIGAYDFFTYDSGDTGRVDEKTGKKIKAFVPVGVTLRDSLFSFRFTFKYPSTGEIGKAGNFADAVASIEDEEGKDYFSKQSAGQGTDMPQNVSGVELTMREKRAFLVENLSNAQAARNDWNSAIATTWTGEKLKFLKRILLADLKAARRINDSLVDIKLNSPAPKGWSPSFR